MQEDSPAYLVGKRQVRYLAADEITEHRTEPESFIITGQADPLVKFDEAQKTIAEAKKVNGCVGEGKPWEMPGTMIYSSDHATPVVTFIHPGAHVVPKGANDMIVQFFKKQAMGK